ncbi:murein biosynthesis integral membrane protein MurJ [Mesosutterella sp. OilRF-GAM-744-9]|uniref:Probable lipid II flippase MurJ n=1 Tax=Mesosutterella porci TaxID=2915351 RepID=A0ABS9MPE4_9BURK|nr:murein biosynthesis integral membrane protein MurJ [Mesosutterella sp. oilRF-744-WT-GAM-9]MCG5030407.1 murein biosynthesis integral membrane protein MurJ [Mesosutterella sp. oilRF-744-WT-GAM-9]
MSLLRSAASVSLLTLLSRITGVIRDMLISRYFGATIETDAFYVAFRLPNMLRRLFAEGAFQQAFVPMVASVRATEGEQRTKAFVDHVFSVLAPSVVAVSILGVLFAPVLVWLIASGLASDAGGFALATSLTRWMFPYIAFMSLVAMSAAVLNTYRKFRVPAFTPVLLNLSFIGCSLLLAPHLSRPIYALAAAVILGGCLQLAFQVPALRRIGMIPKFGSLREASGDKNVRSVLKLMAPALFGVAVAQLSILINTNIASHLSRGAVTWLHYADLLMEFPTALLGVALGTVMLPSLSAAHAAGDEARYNGLLDHGLRLVVLFGIPAAVGLFAMAEGLVAFLFGGRAFSGADVLQTSYGVVGYSVGLIGLIALKIVAPAFYARKDIRTPVKVAALSLVCVQAINLVSVPLFAQAGLALSVGLGSLVNSGTLLYLLGRRGIYRPLPGWGKHFFRIIAASFLMLAVLLGLQWGEHWAQLSDPWLVRAAKVLGMVAAGAAVYGAGLLLLGFRPRDLRPPRGS